MNNIYVKDILDKCDGKLICGSEDIILENFSKDTRTININDVYVGIKGENFEGSTLYKDALSKGASGCILNEIELDYEFLNEYSDAFIVVVPDTIKCLQELASYKRSLYNIPVIGVTGSVGKTSTKDIIASVLSKKYNVLKTEGNYNNHIGVPLTILKLKNHDCLVVEMGMNHLGEISVLSNITKPTISVITNVGTAHIGNLKSRENILKAKLEILDGMENPKLIINNDNDMLHNYYLENKNNNIITFGCANESDYTGINIDLKDSYSNYDVNLNDKNYSFKINIPGEHFVLNGLCALSVASVLGINISDIKDGIEEFELTQRRMQIEKINNITIINDCYNANLDSMKSAITYLGSLNGLRKIAVLGDMLELGEFEEELHRQVGKELYLNKIDKVFLVGNASKYIQDELLNLGFDKENIYFYENNEQLINNLISVLTMNDAVLIKASNGMNFIEIFNKLKEQL